MSVNANNGQETPHFYILSTLDGMVCGSFYDKCKAEAYFQPKKELPWSVNPQDSIKTGVRDHG